MTSSVPHPAFSSIPYTQHHRQTPNPFTKVDTQSHVYGPYEAMITAYLKEKLYNLGPSVGSTRINNFTLSTIQSTAVTITADQLMSQHIVVSGPHNNTLRLPTNTDLLEKFAAKFGSLQAGMTIPVTISNITPGNLTIDNPLSGGSVMIGGVIPRIISVFATQFAFIRIPANNSLTYEFINTTPNVN